MASATRKMRRRRLRFTRIGWYHVIFTFGVGGAAINSGNNLLFLVFGLQLSAILVSGFLSDLALYALEVERELSGDAVEGERCALRYRVRNAKRLGGARALSLRELGEPLGRGPRASLLEVGAGAQGLAAVELVPAKRGRLALTGVAISTRYPFGLFEKSVSAPLPGELYVLPARRAALERAGFGRGAEGERPENRPGMGVELYGLREARQGDDRRRIHWRKSAAAGRLMVVERERERQLRATVLLDHRGLPEGEALEEAIRAAAALLRSGSAQGMEMGLCCAGGVTLSPAQGEVALRRALRALALLGPLPPSAPGPRLPPGEGGRSKLLPIGARAGVAP